MSWRVDQYFAKPEMQPKMFCFVLINCPQCKYVEFVIIEHQRNQMILTQKKHFHLKNDFSAGVLSDYLSNRCRSTIQNQREIKTDTYLWLWQRHNPRRPVVGWPVGSCRYYWAPAPLSACWSEKTALPHSRPLSLWYCPSGCVHHHPAISHQPLDNLHRPYKSIPPHHLAAGGILAPESPQV